MKYNQNDLAIWKSQRICRIHSTKVRSCVHKQSITAAQMQWPYCLGYLITAIIQSIVTIQYCTYYTTTNARHHKPFIELKRSHPFGRIVFEHQRLATDPSTTKTGRRLVEQFAIGHLIPFGREKSTSRSDSTDSIVYDAKC